MVGDVFRQGEGHEVEVGEGIVDAQALSPEGRSGGLRLDGGADHDPVLPIEGLGDGNGGVRVAATIDEALDLDALGIVEVLIFVGEGFDRNGVARVLVRERDGLARGVGLVAVPFALEVDARLGVVDIHPCPIGLVLTDEDIGEDDLIG